MYENVGAYERCRVVRCIAAGGEKNEVFQKQGALPTLLN